VRKSASLITQPIEAEALTPRLLAVRGQSLVTMGLWPPLGGVAS